MAPIRHIRTQLFPTPMYPICTCCEIHGRMPEEQIATIVFVVMEVHRELFTPTEVLIHEEVRATIFALMVEQPQVFQISTTEVDIKPAVRRYMIEHRTEFQGRPGQRGSRGFTGGTGGRGDRGPAGPAGHPGHAVTRGEIAAAVATYHRAEQRATDQGLLGDDVHRFTQHAMESAVQNHREEHPEEQEQPAPRRGLLGQVRRWGSLLAVALAGAALTVAIVAMFFPRGGIDAETLRTMVGNEVATYMTVNAAQFVGPAGLDGKDADPITVVAELKSDSGFITAAQGPVGLNGKDADPQTVANVLMGNLDFVEMAKAERGLIGPAGKDGQAGKDADPQEVASILASDEEFVTTTTGPQGPKGDIGLPGQKGINGKNGTTLEEILAAIEANPTTVLKPVASYLESCGRNGEWHSGNGDSGGWILGCPDGTKIVLAFSKHATERLRAEIDAQ